MEVNCKYFNAQNTKSILEGCVEGEKKEKRKAHTKCCPTDVSKFYVNALIITLK